MNKLAVIGYPISHSLSPAMHNYISKKMHAEYVYEAVEVAPKELENAVLRLKNEGFCGFNVTMPHKIEIMKYLDEISDEAKRYGAANTVLNKNGRLIGYNTDAEGFYMSLRHKGVAPQNSHILMLGAGGAAQAVATRLAQSGPASLSIVNRTRKKAEDIAKYVKDCTGFCVQTEMTRDRYDIVINCTSLGMGKNSDLMPLSDLSVIKEDTKVVDMIYNPPKTLFLAECEKKGAAIMNGAGMLIFQGILAYRIFTGIDVPDIIADDIEKEVF